MLLSSGTDIKRYGTEDIALCMKFIISTAGIPRHRKSGNIPKIIYILNSILKQIT